MTTLTHALREACASRPAETALVDAGGAVTYGELARQAERLSVAYGILGVEPGDRVVCSMPNRREAVIAIAAAWERGAVHVCSDFGATAHELAALATRTGARALVHAALPGAPGTLAEVRAAHPELLVVTCDEAAAPGAYRFRHLTSGEGEPVRDGTPGSADEAIVFGTSGTTGTPKLTLGFHGNLAQRWRRLAGWLEFGPGDAHLAQLPLSHGFGLMMAISALLGGGRLVLLERFDTAAALDAIARERVTVLNGAPAHFRLLLDRLDPKRHDVGSLRLSVGTAAAFPEPLVRAIWERLGVRFMFMYGSSEGVGFATTDREDILRGSVGRPEPGAVLVVDDRREPLPAGSTGELAFSRRVFPVTRLGEAQDGEWYYSGDRGRLDPDGRLYVLGRLAHQIDRGGLKVDPVEVEAALLSTPGILDGAVLGRPDRVLGEVICACVVVDGEEPRPRLGTVRDALGRRLAPYKLPDELHTLPSIPHTPLGKVDVAALREWLAATPHLVERRSERALVSRR